MNVSAYIIFFIPLLVDFNNPEYKFHSNQGLDLLLLFIFIGLIGSVIPVIGWFIILPFGGLTCLVLCLIGMFNGINGKRKELPIIGKYKLIK